MEAKTLQEIINNIKPGSEYTITDSSGKDLKLKGVDFRGHVVSIHKRMKEEDAQKLLASLTDKQVVKQDDKAPQNGAVKEKSQSSKKEE